MERLRTLTQKGFECKNCRMKFDTVEEWRNHYYKFCTDSSKYGSFEGLNKREIELNCTYDNKTKDLSIQNMKQYMKSVPQKSSLRTLNRKYDEAKETNSTVSYPIENPYMDKLSLGDLHGYFHSTNKRKEDIVTQQLRRREAQLIEDIKFYKQK